MLLDFWWRPVEIMCLERCHWSNDFLKEEGEPLVKGDGPVPVLVHLGKGLLPLLRQLEGGGQPETLLGGGRDGDHGGELKVGDLTVPVCVSRLEALPGEPVDLLVAL